MAAAKKIERTHIPDEFRSQEDKDAMLAKLTSERLQVSSDSDDYLSLTNKIAKARKTPVRRKKGP